MRDSSLVKIGEKGTVSFYLQQSVDDNNVRWFGHSMTEFRGRRDQIYSGELVAELCW